MRLWSLQRYLDAKGLVVLWCEARLRIGKCAEGMLN